MTLPLADKMIVVTRAREQAGEFVAELKKLGADIFLFPTIEIAAPDSYAALDSAIENLQSYEWLIFTSANGVEHFLSRLEAKGFETSELDYLRVCAVGEVTANRLMAARIHLDIVPNEFKAEGVFAALQEYIGADFRGNRFLLPQAKVARDFLPEKLRAAGAEIDVAEAYQTIIPPTPETAKLKALIAADSIDCLTFTSSSTVKNFARIFQTANLSQLLKSVKVACIGDIAAQTAQEYGLKVDIMPAEFTTFALAQAIGNYFSTA